MTYFVSQLSVHVTCRFSYRVKGNSCALYILALLGGGLQDIHLKGVLDQVSSVVFYLMWLYIHVQLDVNYNV